MAPRPPPRGSPSRDDPPVAVALKYQRPHDPAPRVVAKGEGAVAAQILELARLHGVSIREDADLVQLLSAVELESQIPMEAFIAVAEILAYIYRAKSPAPVTTPPVASPRTAR